MLLQTRSSVFRDVGDFRVEGDGVADCIHLELREVSGVARNAETSDEAACKLVDCAFLFTARSQRRPDLVRGERNLHCRLSGDDGDGDCFMAVGEARHVADAHPFRGEAVSARRADFEYEFRQFLAQVQVECAD